MDRRAPIRSSFHHDAIVTKRSYGVLADPSYLEQTVRSVAAYCGMRILNLLVSDIAEDVSKLHGDVFQDEGGISVLALISTSHISVHAWPLRGRFMFDLVSCRRFDADPVRQLLWQRLSVAEVVYEQVVNADDSYCPGGTGVGAYLTTRG